MAATIGRGFIPLVLAGDCSVVPGGLSPAELTTVLRTARSSGRLAGMSVGIYNPALDPDGKAGAKLVDIVVPGLSDAPGADAQKPQTTLV